MRTEVVDSLTLVKAEDWNRLADTSNPFVQHQFLVALEKNRCLQEYGWYPQHIVLYDDNEKLLAATPLYIKDNSYGELVFDWSWADAYHRAGLPYYPKLVTAIPYTPVTGPRLLVAPEQDYASCAKCLTEAAVDHADQLGASGVHWLFTNQQDTDYLKEQHYSMRLGCQFHWRNSEYENFDQFLSALNSAKRKKIKRERRYVKEQGVQLEIRSGRDMDDELWSMYHQFYTSTFDRKSGMPTLQLDFFREISQTMPDNIVIVFAVHNNNYVASAFNMRDQTTLYGRHWGCNTKFHSLHFECCYYQGLEYCIRHNLARFEPGAQGEHKISRGFLPVPTWSAHWISQPEFAGAIEQFVERERTGMEHYINSLMSHSPYRETTQP
jgi:predicted N-acyltransferase